MPYARLSYEVTVPHNALPQAREILEAAMDELVVQGIPTYDIEVEESCADEPVSEKPKEGS